MLSVPSAQNTQLQCPGRFILSLSKVSELSPPDYHHLKTQAFVFSAKATVLLVCDGVLGVNGTQKVLN